MRPYYRWPPLALRALAWVSGTLGSGRRWREVARERWLREVDAWAEEDALDTGGWRAIGEGLL